jgi:hypothetical protein
MLTIVKGQSCTPASSSNCALREHVSHALQKIRNLSTSYRFSGGSDGKMEQLSTLLVSFENLARQKTPSFSKGGARASARRFHVGEQ